MSGAPPSPLDRAVCAVVDGDLESLQRLLAAQPELADARTEDKFNTTLLHYVAANGVPDALQRTPPNAVEVCQALLAAGCDPNATSDGYSGGPNSTPLCLLVSSWHPFAAGVQPELVRTLIQGGAHPDGNLHDGAPMTTALVFGYTKAAIALAESGARVDNLFFAAALGDLQAVRNAFEDPNRGSKLRGNALGSYQPAVKKAQSQDDAVHVQEAFHFAVSHNQTDVAEHLLTRGAQVNGRTAGHHSELPLFQAAFLQRGETGLWLLERGADPDLVCGKRKCSTREQVANRGPELLRAALG